MPRQPILSVLGHVDSGKCVSPDTEIQLADGSIIKAERLFEENKEKGERLENQEGEVYELEEGPKVLGVEEGKIKRCLVENIWKLEKDSLLGIKLKDGSKIEVTPEHPFLTVGENELAFREAESLDQADMLAVPASLPVESQSIESLKSKTIKTLSENERILCFVEENFSNKLHEEGKQIEEELLTNHLGDCHRNKRYRLEDVVRICENSGIPLEDAYNLIKDLKQSALNQRAGSTSKKIELPSTIGEFEDLAYTVGLMLGDGSQEATKLYNNSSHLRQEFTSRLENSIGISTQVKTYEQKVDEVYIECGKTLSKFFEILFDFPVEQKSHSIKLSDYALRMRENILGNLISGYFDADGYVNKKGGVEVTSASKEMIDSLKSALKQFGISAYINQEDEHYEIKISGEDNLEAFSKIGFRHPEKRSRFNEHLENSNKNPVTGMTPIKGEQIKKARQELGASHTELKIPYQKRYEEYDKVSKSYLKKFIEKYWKTEQNKTFKLNRDEKQSILKRLDQKSQTRKQIYEKESVDHPRLLNHLLSLDSEGFIERDKENIEITEQGQEILEKWSEGERNTIDKLEKIADSDLKFIEIEEIEEREGGTVYDFTTEAETFIAEDIVVHNTTLLDKIRESRITEGEAGGITQMIGATEVPIETVDEVCGDLLNQLETDLTIPGILFIDTPGHAAFSSLRKRGGSISDIAILVIDIDEGVQPQTEEAINILKESGTPFVVALNKVDKMNGWKSEDQIFSKNIKKQSSRNQEQLDQRIYELMGELNEYDIVADRFDRVDNFQKKVAMVPTSAETGEGIPELLMVVAGLSQRYLGDELEVEEGIGKGTILEVSQEKGLGTTVDVIHYDGIISKNDKLVYGTAEGAKKTDIRALLEPRPLQEIRVDKQYQDVDGVKPASGIKITGKDLEGAISGAPVRTASEEEIEEAIEQVEEELELRDFETQNQGIVVKADSLGSLEAVMMEIEDKEIPVRKASVGPISKGDVVEIQNEDPENKSIIAFNVGRTVSGQEAIKNEDVRVFQSDIIYEIVDSYQEWKKALQEEAREDSLNSISRPAKIRSMPEHVFRSSNPVVAGFKVVDGVLTSGSRLMTLDGEPVGRIKSVQEQNEKVEKAQKGDQVAVSISGATIGRTFEQGDKLIVDVGKDEYNQLQKLDDLLSAGEKKILEEIVEIKDSIDPHWKIG